MKENIKIGLLALIAVTLIFDTFFESPNSNSSEHNHESHSNIAAPNSNNAIDVSNDFPSNPIEPIQQQAPLASESRPKTAISFTETRHDFGAIKQDTKNSKVFTFTNTGSEPLIIEDAKGSCGCTVPVYPKEPIKPGETGEIMVDYSPGKQQGSQTKTVTLTANTDPITTVLTITADVSPVE